MPNNNQLDILDKECYMSLKSEFIQIFNSLRLLSLYQIAGFGALVYSGANASTIESTTLICVFMVVLTWICHKLGKTWIFQAVRQVSYTFVAFEIPRYNAVKGNNISNEDYINNTRGLWILGNRVEQYSTKNSIIGIYKAASEFKLFYGIQIAYICMSMLVFLGKGYVLTHTNVSNTENSTDFICACTKAVIPNNPNYLITYFLISVYSILFIVGIVIFFIHYHRNDKILGDVTREWITYFKEKKKYDASYMAKNYSL